MEGPARPAIKAARGLARVVAAWYMVHSGQASSQSSIARVTPEPRAYTTTSPKAARRECYEERLRRQCPLQDTALSFQANYHRTFDALSKYAPTCWYRVGIMCRMGLGRQESTDSAGVGAGGESNERLTGSSKGELHLYTRSCLTDARADRLHAQLPSLHAFAVDRATILAVA